MGDDWKTSTWASNLGWGLGWGLETSEYGGAELFDLVLRQTDEKEARETIDTYSEKLDQLKAEEAEQSLALLNSALNGEVDSVASLKLAQLEVEIGNAKDILSNAKAQQADAYQSTLRFMDSYLRWKSRKDSDGWYFSDNRNDIAWDVLSDTEDNI